MNKYEVSNSGSAHSLGVYEADSSEAAIEAFCRDAGYDSKVQAEEVMGRELDLIAGADLTLSTIALHCAPNTTQHGQPKHATSDRNHRRED